MKNGHPPLHQTSTYKLANILLSFFPPLTENGYTVANSFHFSEEVCKQDPKTINISIYSLYNDLWCSNWVSIRFNSS